MLLIIVTVALVFCNSEIDAVEWYCNNQAIARVLSQMYRDLVNQFAAISVYAKRTAGKKT
ncbi:MAG: hypothetical protein A3A82_03465 [Candidatus Pacebacteria bacterium RIFCSPLOWO2_01_FULL_47_12]|nr:MAG: hypothetical protein A3A82_03465 [Candidatus Pacebacteria bacterium RIFCSPLOWO2_01_FULL_47_12]